jgi:ketosteroid isomerase-like protein
MFGTTICFFKSLSKGDRMKDRFVVLVILLCASFTVSSVGQANVPAKPLTPTEQTLMAAEKSFVDAAKKGDVAYFKRTLTDDFSFVQFDGQLYDRQDMLDQFGDGGFDLLPYEMKVVLAGDGVAIVTYNVVLRVPAVEDQGPPPRYQHFSTVWVKQGDTWKMKFQQMTASHWGDW